MPKSPNVMPIFIDVLTKGRTGKNMIQMFLHISQTKSLQNVKSVHVLLDSLISVYVLLIFIIRWYVARQIRKPGMNNFSYLNLS